MLSNNFKLHINCYELSFSCTSTPDIVRKEKVLFSNQKIIKFYKKRTSLKC